MTFRLESLAESWPAPVVARSEVKRFSGGLLHPRTLANLDSLGRGPGKIVVGRRCCYDKWVLIEWMKNREGGRNG